MVRRQLADGGEIVIVSDQEAVVNVLKLTRMNKIFRVFADEAAAVAALRDGTGSHASTGVASGE
jgi:anti-anti-sigma regulatory factor